MKILGKYKKRYVVCHMKYQSGMTDIYLVVPNVSGLTQVGKYSYDLNEKYSVLRYQNRCHFMLSENDAIPTTIQKQNQDDIVFAAAEIQTALNNGVMEFLFSRKKDAMLIIMMILIAVCALALIYNIYIIQDMKQYMTSIGTVEVVKT